MFVHTRLPNKIIVLFALLLGIFANTHSLAASKSLGSLLLTFESNVKWEAVTNEWKQRRSAWVAECQAASNPAKVASLLLELEATIQWKAVEAKWKTRRNAWLAEVKAANSMRQLASLLLELESNVKWAAVEDKWKNLRNGWIADLSNVR